MVFKARTRRFDKLLCAISVSAIMVILFMVFTVERIKAMEQLQNTLREEHNTAAGLDFGKTEKWFYPEIPLEKGLQNHLRKCAGENNIPLGLAFAVIEKEPCFVADADGGDSVGLMQINLCHGPREMIVRPEENIRIGCWLLGYLYQEYKNWDMALMAYNCGETGAEIMYFSKGVYKSEYYEEVIQRWHRWRTKIS